MFAIVNYGMGYFGSQSTIVSIDTRKQSNGESATGFNTVTHAQKMESLGAGESMINSIDRKGTMTDYDIDLIQQVPDAVSIPPLLHAKERVTSVISGRHTMTVVPLHSQLEARLCIMGESALFSSIIQQKRNLREYLPCGREYEDCCRY